MVEGWSPIPIGYLHSRSTEAQNNGMVPIEWTQGKRIKIAARKIDNTQWRARRRKWEGHVTINSDNWMVIPTFRTIKVGYGLFLSKKGTKIINPSLHQN